ncbi:hypothetical protein FJY90_06095 [Candidatus Gottesmanbacteria bacterium]|nr:hypothetical protein [Candidatus Gottesmanbacteria bacterium]
MMIKRSIYKIPDGKLVKIELKEKQGKIIRIKITGDFFIYPEEMIYSLEDHLVGCTIERTVLKNKIEKWLRKYQIDCFGITSTGLADAIIMVK